MTELPKEISISTMYASWYASCNLNTKINIDNIEKYLILDENSIIKKKKNNNNFESLYTENKKNKRKLDNNISKNYFYNQITVIIRITNGKYNNLNNEPKINMKLFKNGSIQMSGCKTIEYINIALNKLIFKLKETINIINNNELINISFIENNDITINNFKIDMINSNYKVNIQLDREKLHNLLLKKKIKSSYEPCIRACVIIKYKPEYRNYIIDNHINAFKDVSIFIFQKGNIIITGAKSKYDIIYSYNYINNILSTHRDEIIEEEDLILKLYNIVLEEINLGLIKL